MKFGLGALLASAVISALSVGQAGAQQKKTVPAMEAGINPAMRASEQQARMHLRARDRRHACERSVAVFQLAYLQRLHDQEGLALS